MTNVDTWTARDLPVLRVAARFYDEQGPVMGSREFEEATGLPREDVIRALRALDGEFVDAGFMRGDNAIYGYVVRSVTPSGLRAVGQWPSADVAADRLLEALTSLIDETPAGSPKAGKLRAIRDSLTGIGRDVLVEIAGAAISGRLPG